MRRILLAALFSLLSCASFAQGISNPGLIGTSGTWTPVDGSGAGLSFTITGTPTYFAVGLPGGGHWVIASVHVTYPVTASTAAADISGLPFTVKNDNGAVLPATVINTASISIASIADINGTDFFFKSITAGTNVQNVALSTFQIIVTVSYFSSN